MLAFHTDHYSSRPWCRREVLEAKRFGAHILIVDALDSGDPRSFPYGGSALIEVYHHLKEFARTGTPGRPRKPVLEPHPELVYA